MTMIKYDNLFLLLLDILSLYFWATFDLDPYLNHK